MSTIDGFERALREQPKNPDILSWLSWFRISVGYSQEGLGVSIRRIALEPLSLEATQDFADVLSSVGRTDEALTTWELTGMLNSDTTWVRELVTGARDPTTGQALLDRRLPEIAAAQRDDGFRWVWRKFIRWYLIFGFFDRYFELILDSVDPDTSWTDAATYLYDGMVYRHAGFTAHPKFLALAETIGLNDVWEKYGPPDFCDKVGGLRVDLWD